MVDKGSIFKNSPLGYGLHKIILDETGKPKDYEFIDVNNAFEELTGLKKSEIIGRTVTEALPGIENNEFDWISFYGKVALEETEEIFEQFFEPLGRHYSVHAYSPKEEYFVTIFSEITESKIISEISAKFNEFNAENLDFEYIANKAKEISGAKYAAFNKFDENGRGFFTVAFSGMNSHLKKASALLGFNAVGKKWAYDPERQQKIDGSQITVFEELGDLTGNIIPKDTINLICNIFKIGKSAVVKTTKENKLFGDFTLIFSENQELKNKNLLKTYANLTGMLFSRINAEQKTLEIKDKLENLANQAPGTIYQYQLFPDGSSRFPYASKGIYEIYELSPQEVIEDASKVFERIHPDDYEKVVNSIQRSADNLETWYDEYRVILPQKGEIWVQGKAKPEKQKDGSILWYGNIREITKEKKLSLEVENQKQRLGNIIEGTNVGTWERNLETGEATIDKKWTEILGYKLEELLPMNTKTWEKLIYPQDLNKTKGEIQKLIGRETEYYDVEYRMIHKDGKLIWVNGRGKITKKSKNGKPLLISGTTMDISEKKKVEIKLNNSNNRLRKILETTQDGFWIVGENGKIVDVNNAYCKMSGYTREEILNSTISDIEFLETLEETKKRIEKIIKTGHDLFETKHITKDGQILDVESSISLFSKEPLEFICFFRDITQRKKDKQKIIESSNMFNTLLKNSIDIIDIVDNKGNYIEASDTTADLLGLRKEEFIGKNFKEILPESSKYIMDMLSDINKTKKHIKREETYYLNNQKRIFERVTFPIEEKDDEVVLFGSIAKDITEKVKYKQKIKNERDYIYKIFNSMNQYVVVTGLDYKIQFMNEKAIKNFGDLKGKICYKNLQRDIPCEGCKLSEIEKIKDDESIKYTVKVEDKYLEVSGSKLINRDGSISIVEVIDDVTEKREKQKEIEYLSFHDHLTGLYNRRYMQDSIKRLDTKRNMPFSIIVTDVNGLKLTNDAYGHDMGDKLLIKVSEILKKSCREDDIICRVGGDEFVVLLPGTNIIEAEEIENRIVKESHKASLDSVIISLAIGHAAKKTFDKDILEVYKEADNNMYKNKLKYGKIMRNKTIETVLVNINNKYDHEQIHTQRVSQYCESIARAMNLNSKEIEDSKVAGTLHDIGKIIVPPEILSKEEKLSYEEWETIKKHTITGYQLLKSVDEYSHLAEAVLHHHEKLDGSGYPEGLLEDEIPLLSKIIAVADTYEAMTANRPYQKKKTKEQAVKELKKYSGIQFDEKIVKVFISEVL